MGDNRGLYDSYPVWRAEERHRELQAEAVRARRAARPAPARQPRRLPPALLASVVGLLALAAAVLALLASASAAGLAG